MKKTFLTSIFCIFACLNNSVSAQEKIAIKNDTPAADSAEENKTSEAKQKKADVCDRFKNIKPQLRLRSSYGKLTYNFDYDRENLDIMAARNKLTEAGMFTAGLSLVDVDWSVSLNTVSRSINGRICVIPASVDVFIGYRNPVIYISNDIAEGTCTYEVVLRHERQHQQINVSVLDYYLPTLKKGLKERLAVLQTRGANADEDTDVITDDMNANYANAIRPLINRFQITLQNEQQRLDNRQNYQYESGLCSD